MIWIPFLATALYTVSTVQRKLFLRTSRIPFSAFFPSILLLMALMGAIVAPLDWRIDAAQAFAPLPVLAFLCAVVLGVYWFEAFYGALREESLSRYDLLLVLEPLAVMAAVSLVFPQERDPRVWCAGLIACGALYLGHRNHRRVTFDRGERKLLLAILLSTVLVVIERYLLTMYSALAFNALYAAGIAWLFAFRYGAGAYRTGIRFARELAVTAFFIVSNSVLYFYSYQALGVTVTTLVMLLEPVAVAVIAFAILKEPVKPKLLAAGIVVLAVVAATLWIVRPA